MSKKNERNYWIRKKGREKFEDTKGERDLDALAEYMGLKLIKPAPVRVWKDNNLYPLQPDRRIEGTNVLIHVDGHPGHFTERGVRKDDWKDAELAARGYRNLRIPTELLHRKHWGYVGWCIQAFLSMDAPTNYRIDA